MSFFDDLKKMLGGAVESAKEFLGGATEKAKGLATDAQEKIGEKVEEFKGRDDSDEESDEA